MTKNKLSSRKSNYNFNADIVRVIAIFSVVGIHILSPIFTRPDFFNGGIWWVSYLLNVLFRTSVPLFIILSGYLVLDKETSIKKNLLRVKNRILIPLFSFYTIFHIYHYYAAKLRVEPQIYNDYFSNLTKNTHTYLYFLVILAFLYLLIPLFQPLFKSDNKEKIRYIIIFFFANAILGIFFRYLTLRGGEPFHTFTLWIIWIGYFLFGQWYKKYGINFSRIKLLGILGIGYLITAIFGYLNFYWFIHGNGILYINGQSYAEEYLSVGVILMSLSLFVLLMKLQLPKFLIKNKLFIKGIQQLAVLSYGIYLIHPIIMDYINKFQGITADSPTMPNLWFYVVINATVVFISSYILTYLIQKIPIVKKSIGM